MRISFSIAVVALALPLGGAHVLAAEAPPSILWSVMFHNNVDDEGQGVATGPDGHPVVAGFSCPSDYASCTGRLIKYDSVTGSQLWNVMFDGADANDLFFGVDVGADGHPVAVGYSCDAFLSTCSARFAKFDGASGALLWTATYSPRDEDFATDAAIGPDGHPIVAIESCGVDTINCAFRVVKLDSATGAIIWSTEYSSPGGEEHPVGIDAGADGHPVVTGASCTADFSECDFRTIKLNGASGSIIWNVTFDSGFDEGEERGVGVAVGPDGHAVVNGTTCAPATGCDVRTIKYNGGTGAILWNVLYNSGGTNDDFGVFVHVGADGHPVANAAFCAPYPSCDFRTMKRDGSTGAIIWNVTVPVPAGYDFPIGVTTGIDGNPVVTGPTCDPSGFVCDIRTIKYQIRQDTPAGLNVSVALNGGSAVPDGVSVTYSTVAVGGTTSLTTDSDGPPPPAGFGFIGTPPTYYELSTTAIPLGSIAVCFNYSTRAFAEPESGLRLMHFESGSWVDVTTSLNTAANVICGSVTSFSPFAIAQQGKVLTSLGPASMWVRVGVKDPEDVGIRFDLRAEVFRNGTQLVGSGQIDSVGGGGTGFQGAGEHEIPLSSAGSVAFPPGSTISIRVLVRNACSGSAKNGGAARLWYNDEEADSRFDATLDTPVTYYLHNGFALGTAPGSGPKRNEVASAGSQCSPFKSFGTWITTVP